MREQCIPISTERLLHRIKLAGMCMWDVTRATGIEPEEITRRLKAYEGTILATAKMSAYRATKGGHNNEKHPERNSQFAEKGGA